MRKLLLLSLVCGAANAANPPEKPLFNGTVGATDDKTVAELCSTAKFDESVPAEVKLEVNSAYAVTPIPNLQWITRTNPYVYDCLVPAKLNGDCGVAANVWPQSTTATYYNNKRKDALETRLYQKVCDGTMGLPTAIHIVKTWQPAYVTQINTGFPTPLTVGTYTNTNTNTNTPTNTPTNTVTNTNTNTNTATNTSTPTP